MARREQKPEPQYADGAPEWMVTFSDCMTLLLTFFVLLLSFSSFDDKVFYNLKVIYSRGLATISPITRSNRDAIVQNESAITAVEELSKGSEKKTSEKGTRDALLSEKPLVDINGGKVILIASEKVFWAKGEAISPSGRSILSLVASFLSKVPNRVVISEHGPDDGTGNEHYGLTRAWAVSQYLVEVHGLDGRRFSISAASTLPPNGLDGKESEASSPARDASRRTQYGRTVEIVLLDRSIHD
ncbi:MAG: hypothetical protein JXN61_07645 [Sedimentisphaerales bacterium]|nr:hypothetical protein [Sedimentisphaerales bacterium]